MTRVLILSLLVAATAAGCARLRGDAANRNVEFDGIRFDADLATPGEDERDMVITVTPFAVNPSAALEAGRFEATKHCLRVFGGSDTAWEVGPDTPLDRIPVTEDTITLRGRCVQR